MAILQRQNELEPPDRIELGEHSELSRRHMSRLRFYFQSYRGQHSGHGDAIDLDLIAAGAVNYRPPQAYGSGTVCVTTYGAHLLAKDTQQHRAERSPHHELGTRLGVSLKQSGRLVWENLELKVDGRHVRPDVFSLVATLNEERMAPTIHEVKISRADFLSELKKPEKTQASLALSSHFYFACPEGVIGKSEVPDGLGLVWELSNGEWKTVKRARKRPCRLESQQWMKLLLKATKESI